MKETMQRISQQNCEDCDVSFEATPTHYHVTLKGNYYLCDSCIGKRWFKAFQAIMDTKGEAS